MEILEELAEAPVEVERVRPDDAGGEGGAWQPLELGGHAGMHHLGMYRSIRSPIYVEKC